MSSTSELPRLRAAVVGSGVSGIAATVRLREALPSCDVTIFEKNAALAGTWVENQYPGAACDVPSHFYSFSFALNPSWSQFYSRQPEIRSYLQRVSDERGITPLIQFNTMVMGASWDESRRAWSVQRHRRGGGSDDTVSSFFDILIVSSAALNRAAVPAFPGLDSFTGRVFHTSSWDASFDPHGRRIAVIGTGASAVQVVPALAPAAASLCVFQRTPGWIVPRNNYNYSPLAVWLFTHAPLVMFLYRALLWLLRDLLFPAFKKDSVFAWGLRYGCLAGLARAVPDPTLRAALTPDYPPGCKRLLVTDDYLPALQRPNVSLVTSGITRMTPRGVVTADGVEHEVDTIIMATGFQVTSFLSHLNIVGRGGLRLQDAWRDAENVSAYYGTLITGLPNFFVCMGPNTALGHSSMIFIIERQVEYMCAVLKEMQRRGAKAVEPLPEAQVAYNAWLQRDLADSVWSGSCQSWYKTKSGKIVTLWPHSTFYFWWCLLWPRHHELSYT